MSHWRVGSKVPINVYDDDRPVCQCQSASDASLIVKAVNIAQRIEAMEGCIASLRLLNDAFMERFRQQSERMSGMEDERDTLQKTFKQISDDHDEVHTENAALRKAIRYAPHANGCHVKTSSCCCWKSSIKERK